MKSQFLRDLHAAFLSRRKSLKTWGDVSLEACEADETFEESVNVYSEGHGDGPSLELAVWPDQLGNVVVRETTRKRLHKVLLRVEDAPLLADPSEIVKTYEWSRHTLVGFSSSDPTRNTAILSEIGQRWRSLSSSEWH